MSKKSHSDIRYVYVSKKVEICIEALKKTGHTGATLADKATCIIERLAAGTVRQQADLLGSFTKSGEKRIKKCRKYDLGCGFRLITVQRGRTILVTFLGQHDASQRWLENNRGRKVFNKGKGKTVPIADRNSSPAKVRKVEKFDSDEDSGSFLQHLTDKELQLVFKGLVQGLKKK